MMLASGAGELYTCKDLCSVTRNQGVGMKREGRTNRWCLAGGLSAAAILLVGCATTGTEQEKKETAKPVAPAKVEPAKKPAAPKVAAAKPDAPPAKPKLHLPQVDKPSVPPLDVPVFDWQNAKVAPSNRADVLAMIDKKARPDEFDAMVRVTDMDGKQLAGFLAATEDRLARLREWDLGEKGKRRDELRKVAIPAAQEGSDEAKLKALVAECAQLDAEYGALRVAVRAMVMGVMTLEQQRVWAAQRVMGKVARAMQGTTLTPDQQKKAMRICTEAASELVKDGTVAKDPYFSELLNGQEALIEKTTARVKAEAL